MDEKGRKKWKMKWDWFWFEEEESEDGNEEEGKIDFHNGFEAKWLFWPFIFILFVFPF